MYEDLRGRAAIITGAGRELGIGQAMARRLASEGASVVVSDIELGAGQGQTAEADTLGYLHRLVEDIEAQGGRAVAVACDVTDVEQVQAMVETGMEAFGHVDILVNNAGAFPGAVRLDQMEQRAWDLTLDVCAKGAYLCAKAVIPHMISDGAGGRIINISSIAGKEGFPGYSAYCAAKAAVILLTQTLAQELGPDGITVNAICPGNVDTLMGREEVQTIAQMQGISLDDARREMIEETALKRLATAEDIANVAAFLASEQGAYITGQAINVCGGIIMH
jgi:NAD(P)-dependent dehydrogenase (short-subunit alcohol dehydrogenase family)